LDQLP